jgi:hypothetical protein
VPLGAGARQPPARHPKRAERSLERRHLDAEVERGGEEHVASDATDRLEEEDLRHDAL